MNFFIFKTKVFKSLHMTSSEKELGSNLIILFFLIGQKLCFFSTLFFMVFWLFFLFFLLLTFSFNQFDSGVIVILVNVFYLLLFTWRGVIWCWFVFNYTKYFLSISLNTLCVLNKLLAFQTFPILAMEIDDFIYLIMHDWM